MGKYGVMISKSLYIAFLAFELIDDGFELKMRRIPDSLATIRRFFMLCQICDFTSVKGTAKRYGVFSIIAYLWLDHRLMAEFHRQLLSYE